MSPGCVVSMYGPTDILSLVPVRRGRFENFTLPEITPELIEAALIDPPPTQTAALGSLAEGGGLDPRMLLSLGVIGGGVVGEFLVRGLVDGGLPEKGCVDEDELKSISGSEKFDPRITADLYLGPYYLVDDIRYPPVFQAMGTEDEVFDISQVLSFNKKLKERGVESKVCVVEGKGHSFDMKGEIGDEIYLSVIVPAVNFAELCLASSENEES